MSVQLVQLPDDNVVPYSIIQDVVREAKSLVASGRKDVVLDLMKKVKNPRHRLDPISSAYLDGTQWLQDGKIHPLTASALKFSIAVFPNTVFPGDDLRIVNLEQTREESDAISMAIYSLSLDEFMAMNEAIKRCLPIGSFAGYEKVSDFARNGVPFPELALAFRRDIRLNLMH